MFLVKDPRNGMTNLVFTWEDPRRVGYGGSVDEGVTLDYDIEAVHSWPEGSPMPEACVGRDPQDPKSYKVFKYSSELQSEGYEPVSGAAEVFGS